MRWVGSGHKAITPACWFYAVFLIETHHPLFATLATYFAYKVTSSSIIILYRHFDINCVIKSLGQKHLHSDQYSMLWWTELFCVNVYVVADSYPVLLDNDFCMVDNVATFLLHKTVYKLYCCVGLGTLIVHLLTHCSWSIVCGSLSATHVQTKIISVLGDQILPRQNIHS